MLNINKLALGFSDAENYKKRENKMLFNRIFLKTDALDMLSDTNINFLIGEKGTGKTAYALYYANNAYKENISSVKYIRETEYQKFVTLKKERHLDLSDYVNIWKVILYLLLSQQIKERRGKDFVFGAFNKFKNLQAAIDEYYVHAFSPEILYALQFIEGSKTAAELIAKHAKLGGALEKSLTFTESRFQTNLLFIQNKFEDALASLKLRRSHILFIDGIDIRPSSILYTEYLDCIKGLANAVWSLNTDFFSAIKGSQGRLKIVLLIRPDIFESIGLQNQNTKIRDNSILLDWRTTYADHRNSDLFKITDHLLSSNQEITLNEGDSWNYYFPFDSPNVITKFDVPSSFISFLRLSLYRPRDIITMLDILKQFFIHLGRKDNQAFILPDIENREVLNSYANYLLGEVKDQLSFYYTKEDYEIFLKFFEFLNGKYRFEYSLYINAFKNTEKYLSTINKEKPPFLQTPNDFLQFLFDLNVVCYIEQSKDGESFIRWCFRERSYANIRPKVKTDQRYEIHYGLRRALNLGKSLRR